MCYTVLPQNRTAMWSPSCWPKIATAGGKGIRVRQKNDLSETPQSASCAYLRMSMLMIS